MENYNDSVQIVSERFVDIISVVSTYDYHFSICLQLSLRRDKTTAVIYRVNNIA